MAKKISYFKNDSETGLTICFGGSPIIGMSWVYQPAKDSFLKLSYRRLGDYTGPLPKQYRAVCAPTEFQAILDECIDKVISDIRRLLRYSYVYEKGNMYFEDFVAVNVVHKYDSTRRTLAIHLIDSEIYLPAGMPKQITVGFDITRHQPDTYAHKIVNGILSAFTNEYVWFRSDI